LACFPQLLIEAREDQIDRDQYGRLTTLLYTPLSARSPALFKNQTAAGIALFDRIYIL